MRVYIYNTYDIGYDAPLLNLGVQYWCADYDDYNHEYPKFAVFDPQLFSDSCNDHYSFLIRCIKAPEGTISATPVKQIFVNKSSLTLRTGETYRLNAAVDPADATHNIVEWSSDNPDVAEVDETGKIIAISSGSAIIRAAAGLKVGKCVITVQ